MRRLITLFIVSLICSICFGQIDSTKTEVIIIGTIHTGNRNINHKTLYNILKKIKPDIILNEDSENYKPVFGLKTATFLKIAKPSIEQLALQTFSKRNKNTPILPYDTAFSRRAYINSSETIKQIFYDSLYGAKKSISDSIIYAEFVFKYNFYYNCIDTSKFDRINQKNIIDKSRELYYLEENVLLSLAKKYITDSSIVNSFSNNIQFWNLRNEHMVRKIVNYSQQYLGKRIVVLTGLNHKYYLTDKLSDSKNNIEIIEFWDK
jgi:hypothetical protein